MPLDADHLQAERRLLAAGWRRCGAGDWAVALASPSGSWAARISPFDPAARYTAEVYRRAAPTQQVPRMAAHRALEGGGALTVLELLEPVPVEEAAAHHLRIMGEDPAFDGLRTALREVDALARAEQVWWGPVDANPANVMRAADGRLVLLDPFYADGPALYAAVRTEPDRVVAAFPEEERRFMLDLPLASSGPWDPDERASMRRALAEADERAGSRRRPTGG